MDDVMRLRALLADLLDQVPLEGADRYRRQLASIANPRSSCACGCGSTSFTTAPEPGFEGSNAVLLPVHGMIAAPDDDYVGGLMVYVKSGCLADLEVYSMGDLPLALPDPAHVTWQPDP